jgi:cell division protein FtsI/penicillin-binding protein 2
MHSRIRVLAFFIVIIFGAVIIRLFNIQVLHSSKFKDQGVDQYVSGRSQLEPRGSIYFTRRDGTLISAATMNSGYILAISPKNIKDPESIYNQINEIYKIDKTVFDEKMKKSNDPYEEIARRVPKDTADLLRSKKIKGVSMSRELWRAYPAGSKAAHVLGLVAHVGDYEKGVYGLEKYYEKYLVPPTVQSSVNPFAAVFRNLSKTEESRLDIVTTLEPEVQVALEKTLTDIQEKYSSEGVGGIVMDPKTGAIIAMAYTPYFDPNDAGSAPDESVFLNPAVSRIYEFGSVIKPLVAAAGFDTGVITPDTKYMDTGSIKVGIETIHNFDNKGRGLVDIRKILGQSLNTGMVMISQKLGQNNMRKYFEAYGLRSKTGIDLPSETGSLTKNLDSNRDIEFASASFGQGIAVTPVQVVRAFSALANDGIPANPYLVKEIRTPDGKVVESFSPTYLDRAISTESSKTISTVLTHIVDTELQQGKLAFPHHSVAAKTGTAQMVAPNGKYYEDRYLHSMFAYVPATNPEYLVFLYNVYPKGVDYASTSLSNPLFSYLRFLISYGTIKPDR